MEYHYIQYMGIDMKNNYAHTRATVNWVWISKNFFSKLNLNQNNQICASMNYCTSKVPNLTSTIYFRNIDTILSFLYLKVCLNICTRHCSYYIVDLAHSNKNGVIYVSVCSHRQQQAMPLLSVPWLEEVLLSSRESALLAECHRRSDSKTDAFGPMWHSS